MVQVEALLAEYWVSDLGVEVQKVRAQNWLHILKDYPLWTIKAACREWLSPANEFRRRSPVPGDIAAIAGREVSALAVAKREAEERLAAKPAPPKTDDEKAAALELVRNAFPTVSRIPKEGV